MIPELVDNVLPEGVHECTFEEVDQAFGCFRRSDRRPRLTAKLGEFIEAARRSGIVAAVVIDGSYVTAKEEPSDIDLIVAYRPDFDFRSELRPFEYNVLSKPVLKRAYKFDVFIEADTSEGYRKWVEFFTRVRPGDPGLQTARARKGVLRIVL
jgi:predicted nucleotidyltransferase